LGVILTALGKPDIERALAAEDPKKRLHITPLLDPAQIDGSTVDLRLGTEFLLFKRVTHPGINPLRLDRGTLIEAQDRVVVPFGGEIWLHPRHFILAATLEFIGLPDELAASVVGRSSWGRLGLIVATAITVHPGFRGCLTLELVNEGDSPICLFPGARIAQIEIRRLATPVPADQGSKYQAPVRPEVSRLTEERAEFEALKKLEGRLRSRLGGP
jgi:dCTP deaminase